MKVSTQVVVRLQSRLYFLGIFLNILDRHLWKMKTALRCICLPETNWKWSITLVKAIVFSWGERKKEMIITWTGNQKGSQFIRSRHTKKLFFFILSIVCKRLDRSSHKVLSKPKATYSNKTSCPLISLGTVLDFFLLQIQ